jgi:cobalt-zinc-cadmium efflux system outer membrane protein
VSARQQVIAAAAAWACALAAAGCSVPRKGGFAATQEQVAARSGHQLVWAQDSREDEQRRRLVKEALGRPLGLDQAVRVALLSNPRLQATFERLGMAQADLVQAGMLKNPSLLGEVAFPVGSRGHIVYEAGLVYDFLDLFLLPLRKRMARAEMLRTQNEVADAVLELAAEVRTAFYEVQAAQQIAQLRRTLLDGSKASAEVAARQHEAGNIGDLELASEQGLYAQSKLDWARSEAQVQTARERLNRALGLWGQGTTWTIAEPLAQPPEQEPAAEHLESLAVTHRLDLAGQRQAVQNLTAALAAARRMRGIGQIEVGFHGHREPEGVHVLGPVLRLDLPIFNQGQAQIARLEAQVRQAQRQLEHGAIQIRSEVRAARNRVAAAHALCDYYRSTLIPLREKIVALSERQYHAMLLGVYQLLSAKQAEVNAYREYLEAVRDYWVARSDLERAIGTRIPGREGPR